MNILVFDTETINIQKPFCYDLGYVIYSTDAQKILLKRNYLVKEIWSNLPLFETAYYSDKRAIYEKEEIKKKNWKKICQILKKDLKNWKIDFAFAYNSGFDERVFQFNCEWNKIQNPLENLEIRDIRAFFQFCFGNEQFFNWCENNQKFTPSKSEYSTTAETAFQYLFNELDFIESHTALNDAEIELEILKKCIDRGAIITQEYAAKSLKRKIKRKLELILNGEKVFECEYVTKMERSGKIYLRN